MADAKGLLRNRRSVLGKPPSQDEASSNLDAPEVAPSPSAAANNQSSSPMKKRIDGRSLRRTGRTIQFNTRVSPKFDEDIRDIARREGILIVEVLERALHVYMHVQARPKKKQAEVIILPDESK